MGNIRTRSGEALAEGLRYEKAGLLDKALAQYRDARAATEDPAVRSESWTLEAFIHHARGDWPEALEAARKGAELAGAAGRGDLLADALNAQGTVHYSRGDLEEAKRLFQAMLDASPAPRVRGLALQNLGSLHGLTGELEASERYFSEADHHFEEAGYDWGRAHVQNNRAALALERRDWATAAAASRVAVVVARRIDDLDLQAIATMNLAEALTGLGEIEEAEAEASRALGQFEISGNAWRRVACLRILGDLNARTGEMAVARRMWQKALETANEIGATVDAAQLESRLAGEPGGTGGEDREP